MKKQILLSIFVGFTIFAISFQSVGETILDNNLKVVIIRHGEKPETGDNLSCQGENRALQLAAVLYQKFKKPEHTYVPSLSLGKSTTHARMFQTVTPFAIKYNLRINSKFDEKDDKGIADHLLTKTGTVLLVWEHSVIQAIAQKLGVNNPPPWSGKDFDSIWVITFPNGKASLSIEKEGITPSPSCNY